MEMNDRKTTLERVRERLSYDPATGELRWRTSHRAGRLAGHTGVDGYVRVRFDYRNHYAHRLIWLLHYGKSPDHGMEIDHINGDRLDNRIANLRLASFTQNHWNSRARRDNTSGYKGTWLHKASGLWVARIKKNKKIHHLGYFKTPEEAHDAYKMAATRLHGEFAKW